MFKLYFFWTDCSLYSCVSGVIYWHMFWIRGVKASTIKRWNLYKCRWQRLWLPVCAASPLVPTEDNISLFDVTMFCQWLGGWIDDGWMDWWRMHGHWMDGWTLMNGWIYDGCMDVAGWVDDGCITWWWMDGHGWMDRWWMVDRCWMHGRDAEGGSS